VLLVAAFVGAAHGRAFGNRELAAALGRVGPWQHEVVGPLRAVRRRLKQGPPPAPDAATTALRTRIKQIELAELAAVAAGFDGPAAEGDAAQRATTAMTLVVQTGAGREPTAEEDAADVETHLILTASANRTIAHETNFRPDDDKALADHAYQPRDIGAAVASGSFVTSGMLVAPCSVKTLSGIANCYNDELVVCAADVCLKERRRVVLLLRETPLHAGHIDLMARATNSGDHHAAGACLLRVAPIGRRRRQADGVPRSRVAGRHHPGYQTMGWQFSRTRRVVAGPWT
jgi:hypothetical protein